MFNVVEGVEGVELLHKEKHKVKKKNAMRKR